MDVTEKSSNINGSFLYAKHGSMELPLMESINAMLREHLSRLEPDCEDAKILREIISSLTGDASSEINFYSKNSFKLSPQEIAWLSTNPAEDWAGYLIYRYQFGMNPVRYKKPAFPLYVLIEPTSICNLRCVMCFQVDKSFTAKKYMGRMPWDLFVRVADEAALKGTKAVTLASRGEPTLHPQLGEMIKYLAAKKSFYEIKLNTNATRLNENLSRDILTAGVNEVIFSVDAGTKKTYEEIRVKGKFEEVVSNIARFKEIRDTEFPNHKTATRISGVQVRDDQDIEQMTEFWKQYVDEVTIKPSIPRWDSYNNAVNGIKKPCTQLYERMYVWYDGTINPCDFDYKSELAVGNLEQMTLEQAWNSDAYEALRKKHIGGKRAECFPCDRCTL